MILKLKRTPGIFLTGFMGCGKTTVGNALADALGWTFVDLDQEIEAREKTTIAEIFDARGEEAFRDLETAILKDRIRTVQFGRPQVIALGGGAFLSEENFELVSNNGVTVWLDCAFPHIGRRIEGHAHRPLARDPEQLRSLFDTRRDSYARADYRIEIVDDDPMSVVTRILDSTSIHSVSRKHALRIFRAALEASDAGNAVARHLKFDGATLVAEKRRYRLSKFDRVQVIGAGKAGAAMARPVERLLGRRIAGGFVNVKDSGGIRLRRITLHESGHPIPDKRGREGAQRIADIARDAGERDLLICVISGGASALMPMPAPPISLAQMQQVTQRLLLAGATIHELNTVRKHVEELKADN